MYTPELLQTVVLINDVIRRSAARDHRVDTDDDDDDERDEIFFCIMNFI